MPRLPLESMRSLSLPAVVNVMVSAAGKLILLLVSPVCAMVSATVNSPAISTLLD